MAEPVSLEDGLAAFYAAQGAGGTPRSSAPCSLSYTRPNASLALRVGPKGRKLAAEDAKKRGVPTDFTADGRPIFTSRSHQAKYLKSYGYHNQDGGYGD